jgi:ribosomal protein S5
MAEAGSTIKQAKQRADEVMEDVAEHPWVERMARFGYATKGAVYIVVGALATKAAFGMGGEATDTRGAIQAIENQPFGKVALATVAFGLIGYVIWRWLQAIADPDEKGNKLKGILIRIGYAGSGLVYAGMALTAAKVLIDVGDTDSSTEVQQDWVARLLTISYGRWLVGLAGACVVGFGLYQIYKGLSAKFRKRLKLGEMSKSKKFWATLSGRIGYAARGVVFCIIGSFLIQSARQYDPSQAKGLDAVLQSLSQWPFGPWAMGTVAAGLIAYGFYMLVEARYRRIAGS